eukprot:gene7955-12422_t
MFIITPNQITINTRHPQNTQSRLYSCFNNPESTTNTTAGRQYTYHSYLQSFDSEQEGFPEGERMCRAKCRIDYKEKFSKLKFKCHYVNENLLIQTKDGLERNKFFESLENIHKPCYLETHLKFEQSLSNMNFSEGSKRMMNVPNAGGSSNVSEIISFEFLKLYCQAELEKTEMEINYFPYGSKITDYSVKIGNEVFGVSVTRAFDFRGSEYYTESAATHLLQKKLNGIYWSSKNVVKSDEWKKQILHVFVPDDVSAKIVKRAYKKLKSREKGNSIILVTVIDSPSIFYEKSNFTF